MMLMMLVVLFPSVMTHVLRFLGRVLMNVARMVFVKCNVVASLCSGVVPLRLLEEQLNRDHD